MNSKNLGYCCINLSINRGIRPKDKISVNRGMILKTFKEKGLEYVSELTILNLLDFEKIIKWNIENEVYVYRMSSDMFPCIGFYKLEDLPKFEKITKILSRIGRLAIESGIRLSFHPSHFCVLGSDNPRVIENTIDELDKHAQIMDIMGLPKTYQYPINIHVNTTKGGWEESCIRFSNQFQRLSESSRHRLVVENDDGKNQYSVKMLYDMLWSRIKIPITFDFHHWKYGPSDQTMEEALKLASSTWGGIRPLMHMSSPKTIESPQSKETAHADYIYEEINTFGVDIDVEIEAKAKDLALIKYRNDFIK
jgi:UV DNA damage endonuclease